MRERERERAAVSWDVKKSQKMGHLPSGTVIVAFTTGSSIFSTRESPVRSGNRAGLEMICSRPSFSVTEENNSKISSVEIMSQDRPTTVYLYKGLLEL